MAELSAIAYEDKYNNAVTGLLKDQNNKEIIPARHRSQVTDTKDSFVNYRTDVDKYIRSTEITGTTDYVGTISTAGSIILIGGAIYVLRPASTNTGAVTVDLSSTGAKKVFKNPTTQITTAGEFLQNALYFVMYQTALDGGNGAYLVIGGIPSSGAGVTDGDKVGVQVSDSGATWLPSDYVNTTVSTAGSTITLPHGSKYESFFTGLTSFATPKDVVRTNEERTMRWTFMWEVTDLAATLDFGSDTRSSSEQFAGGVFTPLDVGSYKVVATRRYDDIWWLDFRGVYSVGDTPPTPADLWVLSTGIWNNSEFWDNDAIWRDEV